MQYTGTDEALSQALPDINLPTLLMVLATITGDDRYLSERFAPAPIEAPEGSLFPDDSGRYSPEITAEIHAEAHRVLAALRNGELAPVDPLSQARFQRMMAFSVAEPVSDGYAAMLMEETAFVNRDDHWRPTLERALTDGAGSDFHVVIIGAGMSGLGLAAKLQMLGMNYTVFEKNDAVGGTWYENTYPDCGVDTPNHFYSYSFNRNPSWSGYFSKRDELYQYFEDCADTFGVRDNIRFETEVTSAIYDDASKLWQVTAKDKAGNEHVLPANLVVSAVGQLNRYTLPDIPGVGTFGGESFHSARWRSDVDLSGKRVLVIGTGCSAVQLLPKTAEAAAEVTVFQRSPHWVAPSRDYYKPVEAGLQWALKHIPYYAEWHRARMIWSYGDRVWPAVEEDADWPHLDRSMNADNEGMREALTQFIKDEVGNRTELVDKCVPDFPVWGKRLIVDNGWYRTLARDNVDLVTTPIEAITERGIRTNDGTEYEADVLIYATGFKTNQFLFPMDVRGKNNQSLSELWGDSPNAFKGVSIPGFPNLALLYGPNTNIVHGGSIIYQVECQIHYIMQALAFMLDRGVATMDIKSDANERYNDDVQAISRKLAWGHPNVESWYKNSDGRVINNSPFSLQRYWEVTHDLDTDDYQLQFVGSNEAA